MKKLSTLFIAVTFMTLLCVPSLAYAAPTDPVQNGSVGLEGVVKGNPPTNAPTITTPSNGQSFSTLPIKVSGLCTSDLLVKIFRNGVFGGSAQCVNGAYSLSTDLFDGKNDLIARQYDALDQVSPDSNTVTVTYAPGGFNTSGSRITLTSNYAKRGANPKESLVWPIILSGGTGPYAISIDWGDGKTDLLSRANTGEFNINHIYESAGVYTIVIKGTDANGISAFLQLVAIANGAIQDTGSTGGTERIRTIILWWPLIVAAVLIFVTFWLGKRHELSRLKRQAERNHAPRP